MTDRDSTAAADLCSPAKETERIEARPTPGGYELRYNDTNPDTRYHPREQSTWERLKESWELSWRSPSVYDRGRDESRS